MAPKIYIASPYTGKNEEANVMVQHQAFFELFMMGYMPFAPLLSHYQHQHYPMGYDEWIAYDLQWLASCDAVLRLPGDSKGADTEVAEAKRLGIPVFMGWDEFKLVHESWAEGKEISTDFKEHGGRVELIIALQKSDSPLCKILTQASTKGGAMEVESGVHINYGDDLDD